MAENDLDRRFKKRLIDLKSVNDTINNIKELSTYFKNKNHKSKKRYKKYKMITTVLKSLDTIVIIATTSFFISLNPMGTVLIVIPISTAISCGLTVGNKVIHEIVMQKHKKYEKQYGKDQQTIKSFDKSNSKSLQDYMIDKNEYESLSNIFTKVLDESENEFFL